MYHVPVMPEEVVSALNVEPGKRFLDCTAGGGNHSALLLERGADVVALDRDDDALQECENRFAGNPHITLVKANFKDVPTLNLGTFDGALMDLGVSSHQFDVPERGFSYNSDGPLDMRMDVTQSLTAYDIINGYDAETIADILYKYGDEKFSRRIARRVEEVRKVKPIQTTFEFRDIVLSCVPHKPSGNPAKKSFQAIRIAVNGEIDGLESSLEGVFDSLKQGARFAVITFHSIEDRIVKNKFRLWCTDCICPKTLPVCVCHHKAEAKQFKKVTPSQAELNSNKRSRSATLRYIEKITSEV